MSLTSVQVWMEMPEAGQRAGHSPGTGNRGSPCNRGSRGAAESDRPGTGLGPEVAGAEPGPFRCQPPTPDISAAAAGLRGSACPEQSPAEAGQVR